MTGWSFTNFHTNNTTSVDTTFTPSKHDGLNKQFSTKYLDPNTSLGTVITGQGSTSVLAGDIELDDLLTMLFRHPETPKFICRKLYRFFVNPRCYSRY